MLLEQVAQRLIRQRQTAQGVLLVAIDGVDGAGKTYFADEMTELLRRSHKVIRASVDGFHHPSERRYRLGRTSPEGFYRDSYDYEALKRELLMPLQECGSKSYRTAIFDVHADQVQENQPNQASGQEILLLDGIFLHRPELREVWHDSVFLRLGFETSLPRGAARGEGFGSPDPTAQSNRRYIGGQQLYFQESQPETYAGLVIDNTSLDGPFIVLERHK